MEKQVVPKYLPIAHTARIHAILAVFLCGRDRRAAANHQAAGAEDDRPAADPGDEGGLRMAHQPGLFGSLPAQRDGLKHPRAASRNSIPFKRLPCNMARKCQSDFVRQKYDKTRSAAVLQASVSYSQPLKTVHLQGLPAHRTASHAGGHGCLQ